MDNACSEKDRRRRDSAWPGELEPPTFDAKGTDAAVSTLTLTCEEVRDTKRYPPATAPKRFGAFR
jgi:hypothetical protein